MLLQILSIIALLLSITGNILINHKKKFGFIIWIISNVFWITINFRSTPNYPQVLMYVVYVFINWDGFIKWKRPKKEYQND
jgi:nicotinamide riboside transporter PnuC